MRIKTLLLVSALALLAFTGLIGTVTQVASRQAERIAEQGTLAERLMEDIFQLHALSQAYVSAFEERPKAQWYRQYALIDTDLESPLFAAEPSSGYRDALRADVLGAKASFDELVARHEHGDASDAVVRQLVGDVVVMTQRISSDAHDMALAADAARSAARMRNDRLVFALLVLLSLASATILLLLYGRIARPLVRLQQGAEMIGHGDLGHKIGIASEDEVGRLSRAFDEMSEKLKHSYTGLEAKVQARTRDLQELSLRNEILLESIGDGVAAIDKDWNLILWNEAAARITGWTRAESLGKQLRDRLRFIRERDRADNLLFISEAMLTAKTKLMENHTLLVRKDGTEVPVADSVSPVIGRTGEVEGAIIVFRDAATERDANLIRSSFAYASHQLQAPVIKALWALDAALEESEPPLMREKVTAARLSLQSIKKLVSEIVEVSEIDQGVVRPNPANIEANDVVGDAIAAISAKAKAKSIRTSVPTATGKISLSVDRKLLARALEEILENAVEYSPKDTEIAVSVAVSGKDVVFEVRDAGIGIPIEQQILVFTKFFRGQNIPEESVGAGLGLYMCSEYVKLLGGKVWFKSEKGKGSSFFVSIPLTHKV